ncbi:hypothetical protein [Vulcanisaeta sp. JCM 14467]|nr:hypothetical protein [Vulcanisaeta sp. JCM 14467]
MNMQVSHRRSLELIRNAKNYGITTMGNLPHLGVTEPGIGSDCAGGCYA